MVVKRENFFANTLERRGAADVAKAEKFREAVRKSEVGWASGAREQFVQDYLLLPNEDPTEALAQMIEEGLTKERVIEE